MSDPYLPPPPSGPPLGAPAGAGVRLGARILDGLIVGIPLAIVLGVIVGFGFVTSIVSSIVGVLYFTFMESSSGQTIGKKLLGLRTVGPNGGLPTQQQAFLRSAWTLLGIIPFLGSLATLGIAIWIGVSIGSGGQGPHDGWAGGTNVVRV